MSSGQEESTQMGKKIQKQKKTSSEVLVVFYISQGPLLLLNGSNGLMVVVEDMVIYRHPCFSHIFQFYDINATSVVTPFCPKLPLSFGMYKHSLIFTSANRPSGASGVNIDLRT